MNKGTYSSNRTSQTGLEKKCRAVLEHAPAREEQRQTVLEHAPAQEEQRRAVLDDLSRDSFFTVVQYAVDSQQILDGNIPFGQLPNVTHVKAEQIQYVATCWEMTSVNAIDFFS